MQTDCLKIMAFIIKQVERITDENYLLWNRRVNV